MEKIIVYTCITGGYDELTQPCAAPADFEFICFVRQGEKTKESEGVWRFEELPFNWKDDVLLSRSVKLNPQSFLPEDSDWSLWIDGNVRIADESIFELCRNLRDADIKYAGIRHPFTDCPYEEALTCLRNRRERLWKLLRLVYVLRKNNVPEHSGMMENNIIFRKHNDEAVMAFDRWWWECMVKYTHRDQLVHTMCLLDTPELRTDYLFPEGVTARNHPGIELTKHPAPELNWIQRKLKYGLNKPESLILKQYIKLTRPKD